MRRDRAETLGETPRTRLLPHQHRPRMRAYHARTAEGIRLAQAAIEAAGKTLVTSAHESVRWRIVGAGASDLPRPEPNPAAPRGMEGPDRARSEHRPDNSRVRPRAAPPRRTRSSRESLASAIPGGPNQAADIRPLTRTLPHIRPGCCCRRRRSRLARRRLQRFGQKRSSCALVGLRNAPAACQTRRPGDSGLTRLRMIWQSSRMQAIPSAPRNPCRCDHEGPCACGSPDEHQSRRLNGPSSQHLHAAQAFNLARGLLLRPTLASPKAEAIVPAMRRPSCPLRQKPDRRRWDFDQAGYQQLLDSRIWSGMPSRRPQAAMQRNSSQRRIRATPRLAL